MWLGAMPLPHPPFLIPTIIMQMPNGMAMLKELSHATSFKEFYTSQNMAIYSLKKSELMVLLLSRSPAPGVEVTAIAVKLYMMLHTS